MAEQAVSKINALRRRWITYQVLADAISSAAIALAVAAVLLILGWVVWFAFPVFWGSFVLMLVWHRPWRLGNDKVVNFLNSQYPELQESTGLLLLPAGDLNVLQSLAASQTAGAFAGLRVEHKHFAKRMRRSLLLLFLSFLSFMSIKLLCACTIGGHPRTRGIGIAEQTFPMEKILPQINGIQLTITPPAYTRKAKREQDRFNLIVEEGAAVTWDVKTNVALKSAFLLFNDKERVILTGTGRGTEWRATKNLSQPAFYQVSIDGKLSDLYQVQIVKDAPPVIRVKTPKQYTYINAGEAQQVNVSAALTDDYGIGGAMITATVAKGRGEGVKFKEYKLNFNTAFAGRPQYDVQKLISLPALNMEPGDELYFYVEAKDTHQQQTRTDVFTVAIQDTAELLSMDGVLSATNLKPEFFRSERQIIIDAEKLLKDKDSIAVAKFNARSNDLGIDQKLLRLRYGKFLGEEDEAQEGPKTGGDQPADPSDFSNATKILKEYTDDHDKAEDAQFFEPAIKAQLKATLTEMWKAELQLRLYKPQAALPFAYKALRLLKDLQQKSRSFVAKTAYNPTPIKLDKRLTGELDIIIQPVNKQVVKPVADQLDGLKKAVTVLEQLKIKPALTPPDIRILQVANQQLSVRASSQPGSYLSALAAMRRLSAQKISRDDVNVVERAIQKMLPTPKLMPSTDGQPADLGLSRSYYKNLKQAKP